MKRDTIIYFFIILIMISLFYLSRVCVRRHTAEENCERYENWAWIHAPTGGLVSQISELDTPWLR